MSSPLLDRLNSGKHKNLFASNTQFAIYSTGFKALDAINAFTVSYINKKGETCTDIAEGIIGGRFIAIVGCSGTGKSTLADQIAWNIVKPYPNGLMMHVDAEQTVLANRVYETLGISVDDEEAMSKIIINKDSTYIEDVLSIVDDICANKEVLGKEVMYEADGRWFGKKTIWIYEPTVIIVDALPSFVSKSIDTTVIDGQMTVNRDVAMVGQFYQKLLPKMNKYNITIIATNHIRPKIIVNPYDVPPAQAMLLNKSETLPRGQAPIYYSTSIFRLNAAGKSAVFKEDTYGFEGFECTAQATKSKTAFIGSECKMIFRDDCGFDEAYSLLATAYDNSMIEGRNPYLYLTGEPDFKFSRKEFGTKYKNDPDFKQAVLRAMEPIFNKKIKSKLLSEQEQDKGKLITDEHGNLVVEET